MLDQLLDVGMRSVISTESSNYNFDAHRSAAAGVIASSALVFMRREVSSDA